MEACYAHDSCQPRELADCRLRFKLAGPPITRGPHALGFRFRVLMSSGGPLLCREAP